MIHGKSKSLDGGSFFKKPHFCPKCKTKMEPVTIKKVVNSNSPDSKNYDFSLKRGISMAGNIEFSWKELKCPKCDFQITKEEMEKVEFDSLDYAQQVKYEKMQNLKAFLFMFGLILCAIFFIFLAIKF